MSTTFNEQSFENALIELFQNNLGYTYECGYNLQRDYTEVLLLDRVFACLQNINPHAPMVAIQEAVKKIKALSSNNLLQSNEIFTNYLQNGVEVTHVQNGQIKSDIINLIDFSAQGVRNNQFLIVNQFTIQQHDIVKRPDILVFVNGFPLVVIELKSCSREATDSSHAYRQIKNYMHDISNLFIYNSFNVISDMSYSKLGTITASEDRYMEWKSKSGDYEETKHANFVTLFEGVFEKERFLNIIKNFVLFTNGESKLKIVSAYHQYFAVNKAVNRTVQAMQTNGKAGVVWHTQGSGKSFSMVFYAHLLQKYANNPTIVVLTDRNDLDGQLYETFAKCKDFLRQTPMQAESREDVKHLLKNRVAGGIIFSTMQKFEESDEPLSERKNIVVMADEAHRSQYGLTEKVNEQTGKVNIGYARMVRNSLPNATFIGFTGTPIDTKDKSTQEVFGSYIDIYDITQAVLDNATKPIYYESRVVKLSLDEKVFQKIDKAYEEMLPNAEEYQIEKSKKDLAKLEEILSSGKTISTLCADILKHYKETRAQLLSGKAMIVAYSRLIAIKIWQEIVKQSPDMLGKVKVVMTNSNSDPEEWRKVAGVSENKKDLEKEFKDNSSNFKIAIVVDMWLTGFDLPSLHTMYVFKPMKEHNLMQAIARVNRVFKDKQGGLIVDYIGIAQALKQAMKQYTVRDQTNFANNDISTKTLPIFQEKLSICRDFMYGFNYEKFITGSDLNRANLIVGGVNHILKDEEYKNVFLKEALALHQAESLCMSLLDYNTRLESAFFESVRVAITRINQSEKLSLKDINQKIAELLKHAIKAGEVINIFAESKIEFSIFDDSYLASLQSMKEKNVAVAILSKLLNEELRLYERTNLVQSELFSEKIKRIMISYNNGQINNIEVLDELVKIAREMKQSENQGVQLGLSKEEKAFYDALLKPQALKDYYVNKNEDLIQIVRELTDMLNKNKTIDWQQRETARADMRSMVKRLLKKYNYPPKEREEALSYVMAQCERWADNI